jgi:hypothetical protein
MLAEVEVWRAVMEVEMRWEMEVWETEDEQLG